MAASFAKFWTAYPVKVGKLAAMKVWKRLKPSDAVVAQILQSIEDHNATRQWQQGYIPHPTTFLNQGRYLDELETPPHSWVGWQARCKHVPKCGSATIHDVKERIARGKQ